MTPVEITEVLARHKAWLADPNEGARADLSGADLFRADLSGADLSGAKLCNADLSYANLAGADLSYANLAEANLVQANLSGADLSGANLFRADLSYANLAGADLAQANLFGADLSCAGGVLALGPLGARGHILIVSLVPTQTYHTGCFDGDRATFLAAVAKTHPDDVHGRAYLAAVALVDAVTPPAVPVEESTP